jgi:hypothetical protein
VITTRRNKVQALTMLIAVVFGMAPTVGDIGSCGQAPDALDAPTFFDLKARTDCTRCSDCGLRTKRCASACNDVPDQTFPAGCEPLVHDGEVCLRALLHASCSDYTSFVNDAAPTAPSECQFCPVSR